MNFEQIKKKLFTEGREYGFLEMELYQEGKKDFQLRVFNKEIDHYSIEEGGGVSFRGKIDGKMGYAYTEKLNENSVNELLMQAKENALISNKKDEEVIFSGHDSYEELTEKKSNIDQFSITKKIELIKSLETAAFARDKRVEAVDYCLYGDETSKERLSNSKGLDLEYENSTALVYLSVVVREGDDVKTGSDYILTKDLTNIDINKIAHKAVDEAVSLLGARSLPSKSYPVILRHDVTSAILATFSSTLSAENVQKNLSLFKNKLGKVVAAEKVTIVDDPFFVDGARTSFFDGEGVATRRKDVIKEGVLTTYLHNLKTAKKDGVQSTGNAFRGSYKSSIGVAPTNMYIQPGKVTYEKMIESVKEGIIIIDVQGLHSGANPVSGDFSLSASGYYVKDGKIIRPVEQITIAGNFLDLLMNVEEIADDFKMTLPTGGHFGSASLKVKELSVAGE